MIYHIERSIEISPSEYQWVSLCKPTSDYTLARNICNKHASVVHGSTRVVMHNKEQEEHTEVVMVACDSGWKE